MALEAMLAPGAAAQASAVAAAVVAAVAAAAVAAAVSEAEGDNFLCGGCCCCDGGGDGAGHTDSGGVAGVKEEEIRGLKKRDFARIGVCLENQAIKRKGGCVSFQ